MGRSPASGWLLQWHLKSAGIALSSFAYSAAFQSFASIERRLTERLCEFAQQDDYFLVGHSLGGVLLRAALAKLPAGTPQPSQLFLLGSPTHSPQLARQLANHWLFKRLTGDCGQQLASEAAMEAIPPPSVPTTAIVGDASLPRWLNQFAGEKNDGIVSFSEVDAVWIDRRVEINQMHTLLPSCQEVAKIIAATVLHRCTR